MSFNPAQLSTPPTNDPWVDRQGLPSSEILNYFLTTLLPAVQQTPSLAASSGPVLELTAQAAAVASTDLNLGSLSTGVYRVSVYLRVEVPAGVASSVTPVLSFVDDGVTCTVTGTALTANAINVPSGQTFVIAVDQPGPIAFSTTYASNPAAQMQYKAVVTAERIG